MSKLPELTLTKAGAALLAKTPIGSEIPVTKWRIGDGQLPGGEEPRDRTQLVHPVRELPIASVKNDGNQCLIKGQLVNSEMEAFTWRETGLYATDPDDGEVLYAYGYEADGAEIPAGATQLREIEFGVELVFDNAANVTAVISKTLVFASLADLEQTKADAVEETLEQISTSPVAEDLTDSDAFATVTAAGIQRTPLSLLKQILGKLFAPAPLTSNLTLYVNAATGSDSNDGLTAEMPKKTIMAAVNLVPKGFANGAQATIHVAAGTYNEQVNLSNFYGSRRTNSGSLVLSGADEESCHITGGLLVDGNTTDVMIGKFSVSGNAAGSTVRVLGSLVPKIYNLTIDASENISGVGLRTEVCQAVANDITINNAQTAAVTVSGGTVYLNGISGSSNAVGIQSGSSNNNDGTLVVLGDQITIEADTKYKKVRGGAMIQNGVLI